jgi:hypothetical protein
VCVIIKLGRCDKVEDIIIMKVSYFHCFILILTVFLLANLWSAPLVLCMDLEAAGHGNPGFTPDFNPPEENENPQGDEDNPQVDRPLTYADVTIAAITTTGLAVLGWVAWPYVKGLLSHAWWVWGKLFRGERPHG